MFCYFSDPVLSIDVTDDGLLSLQARADFARVDVRVPSLEEIFVGYLHPDKVPGAGGTWTPANEPAAEEAQSQI